MKKFKELIKLFLTMFKIGLFTFGGGYAMIAVIEREITEKRNWLSHEEFLDVIAIAESTPGPLAVNTATYLGYKRNGFWGAFFSTLGVVLPSFIVILLISLFFDAFLKLKLVNAAFKGIQSAVAFLIISAGIKMFKHLKPTAFNIVMFVLAFGAIVLITLFSFNFSTVFIILIAGFIGVVVYLIGILKNKNKLNNKNENNQEDLINDKVDKEGK
ncbi:MAG: chromate transporter [Clostridia bacterium]|nr:chromate transporter [Clostridia bacterium]